MEIIIIHIYIAHNCVKIYENLPKRLKNHIHIMGTYAVISAPTTVLPSLGHNYYPV